MSIRWKTNDKPASRLLDASKTKLLSVDFGCMKKLSSSEAKSTTFNKFKFVFVRYSSKNCKVYNSSNFRHNKVTVVPSSPPRCLHCGNVYTGAPLIKSSAVSNVFLEFFPKSATIFFLFFPKCAELTLLCKVFQLLQVKPVPYCQRSALMSSANLTMMLELCAAAQSSV